MRRILIRRQDAFGLDAETHRKIFRKLFGILDDGGRRGVAESGDQLRIAPQRLAVLAPVKREGPARQAFARIPFSLPVMQETARRETLAQAAD